MKRFRTNLPGYQAAQRSPQPDPARHAEETVPLGQRTFQAHWPPRIPQLTPTPLPVRSRAAYLPAIWAHPYRHLPLNMGKPTIGPNLASPSFGRPQVNERRTDWRRQDLITPGVVFPGRRSIGDLMP